MSYEQLQKLAKNPFYTLSKDQLALLEKYRSEEFKTPVKHPSIVNKHNSAFRVHDPSLKEEKDVKSSRS